MNTILWSVLLSTTIVLYATISIPVINAAPSSSSSPSPDDISITSSPPPATENQSNIPRCDQTEYLAYVNCIRQRNDIRRKRDNDLNNNNNNNNNNTQNDNTQNDDPENNDNEINDFSLDCRQLNFECLHQCASNSTCEAGCPICPINYGDSINQIGSDDYRTVILEDNNGQSEIFQARIEPGRNITTIIRLTNIINNTHTINIPTNVTNKNLNQIHVHTLNHTKIDSKENITTEIREGGKFGLGETDKGSCCFAVRPKSCSESSMGLRCHHRRHRTCGPHCKSRIVHIQIRNQCHHKNSGSKKCEKKIAYIPQPKPSCIYINQWPFVVCGTEIPDNHHGHRKKSCNGCYDHYGYGYSNYHNGGAGGGGHGGHGGHNDDHAEDGADDIDDDYNEENYDYETNQYEEEKWNKKCRGCYDDAFDIGPLYRRGPVLRPYYYHQPPCFLTGTCGVYGFGDEYTDPAWDENDNNYDQDDEYYDDDNITDNNNNKHHGNGTGNGNNNNNDATDDGDDDVDGSGAGDWAVDLHKCRVVSDDGTIEIRNCSDSEDIENPFASSPKIQLTDDNNEDFEYNARHRRQIKKHYREKERRRHQKRHLNINKNNHHRQSVKRSRYPTINSDEEDNYVDYNEDDEQIKMIHSKIIEDDEPVNDIDSGGEEITGEYDDHPYNPNHIRNQRRQRKKPHHHRRREYVYSDDEY